MIAATPTALSDATRAALLAGVEALLVHRLERLQVDQTELWLGLEPAETAALLAHFESTPRPRVEVLSSAAPEALARRNRSTGGATLLVVLDERWKPASRDYGQSLQEGSRKRVAQLLAESVELPIERVWLTRADRTQDEGEAVWVRALFDTLRGRDRRWLVRDRDGQPMPLSLAALFGFLAETTSLEGEPPSVSLGRGFHRLKLFSHPALAQLRPKRKPVPGVLEDKLAHALSLNYRAARDPDDFRGQLESQRRTAPEVLDDYVKKGGRLTSRPEDEKPAVEALLAFLRGEDHSTALRVVEWEFHHHADVSPGGRKRGRGRLGGVRGLLSSRAALAEKRLGIVDMFVDRARARNDDEEQVRREIEALVHSLGRSATSDHALAELRSRAATAWSDAPGAKEHERLLGQLETVHNRTKKEVGQEIRAATLVEALVEAGLWVRQAGEDSLPSGPWTLSFPGGAQRQPIEPHSPTWRLGVHKQLRQAFAQALQDELTDADEEGDVPEQLSVELELAAGTRRRTLVIHEPWDRVHREAVERVVGRARLLVTGSGGELDLASAREEPVLIPALGGVVRAIADLASTLHPCGPCSVEPVEALVLEYQRVLEAATSEAGADRDRTLRELRAKLKALGKGAPERFVLLEQIEELGGESDSRSAWSAADRLALARLQTVLPESVEASASARGPSAAWLMPLHPLVLRARAVADDLGLGALELLMDPGRQFTEGQLARLEESLDALAVPAPTQVLAPWHAGDHWPPLVLQGSEQGFSAFGLPRSGQARGRSALLRAVRDFVELYPAARDRLVLYLEADPDGRLAYQLATGLALAGQEGASTVDGLELRLASGRAGGFPFLAGCAAARAGADEALFGVTRGRLKPRVLFRSQSPASPGQAERPAHVAVVQANCDRAGGAPPLLRANLVARPVELDEAGRGPYMAAHARPLSLEAVVALPSSTLAGQTLVLPTARDRLDLAYEGLQAWVHFERPGSQFVTEVNLAPEQNGAALTALHELADWVLLVSDLPVARAVELFDRRVRLVDRKTFFDSGRELHLTVSTSHSDTFLQIMGREVRETLGPSVSTLDPGALEALLDRVRRFSPGLAMRYVGRPDDLGPSGLLGLILSAHAATKDTRGSVAIPLDEHPWLYGRRGLRADVLAILPAPDQAAVILRILESKYASSPTREAVSKAILQVERSVAALQDWVSLELLAPYLRRRLLDAVLAHSSREEASEVIRLLMSGAPVRVDPVTEVHLWTSRVDAAAPLSNEPGVKVIVHPTSDTRRALRELLAARRGSEALGPDRSNGLSESEAAASGSHPTPASRARDEVRRLFEEEVRRGKFAIIDDLSPSRAPALVFVGGPERVLVAFFSPEGSMFRKSGDLTCKNGTSLRAHLERRGLASKLPTDLESKAWDVSSKTGLAEAGQYLSRVGRVLREEA